MKEEGLIRLSQDLSILNTLTQTVNQSIDIDEILNSSLDKIVEISGVKSAGVYLFEDKTGDIIFTASRGFSKSFQRESKRIKQNKGLIGKAILSGEPIFIEDYPNNPEASQGGIKEGIKALAIIPLKSRDKVYGTLSIVKKEFSEITPLERSLFNSVGQIISGGLERAYLYSENLRRLEEQKTLYLISQEIASKLELDIILRKIIESAVGLLGAEAGEITLWDNRKQNYSIAIVHGLPNSLIGKEFYPPWSGIVGEIISKKVPVLFKDYENHPERLKELDNYHFKEVLGVPLIVREMIIGAMVVRTSNPNKHFKQNEMDLLFNFAHQAAIAIGNARLYEDSLTKIRQLTTMYEIGKTLSSTLDIDELFKKALELLRDHWGYTLCAIFLLNQTKDELYIKQITGKYLDEVKEKRFRVGVDGIVGWVAKTGEPLYVPDVTKDPRYISGRPDIKSEAAFPLKIRDRIIGVLDVESSELRGFDDEDLKLLSSFASQVSIFIENAQLFSDLKRTLHELRQAQDQIIQTEKLKALGEMASGVAHDFNNVLAVILGNIQLLIHQLDHLKPEDIKEQLKIIEKSAKDGAETIRRIQEFTGKRRDKEFMTLSLNEIIKEVVIITQPRWKDQAQKRGIQIQLSTELNDIPLIMGNPSELREVLTNIIFNAVDAMPQGGTITISSYPQTEDWVEIRISDTGIGMTEEVKRRVFDPFFTTKGVSNSGLGMSVSYGIIKRHGGDILIESEPGKGTTFIIHLPTGYGEEEQKVEEIIQHEPFTSARILVIDDEASVRDILTRMLRIKGHHVVTASNGEEGIEIFKKGNFDLVFTDLGMPKVSGLEVGKAIKNIDSNIPVAMITGWGMEIEKEKLSENGIDLVISKPFNFDQVIRLVSEAMKLKKTSKNNSPI